MLKRKTPSVQGPADSSEKRYTETTVSIYTYDERLETLLMKARGELSSGLKDWLESVALFRLEGELANLVKKVQDQRHELEQIVDKEKERFFEAKNVSYVPAFNAEENTRINKIVSDFEGSFAELERGAGTVLKTLSKKALEALASSACEQCLALAAESNEQFKKEQEKLMSAVTSRTGGTPVPSPTPFLDHLLGVRAEIDVVLGLCANIVKDNARPQVSWYIEECRNRALCLTNSRSEHLWKGFDKELDTTKTELTKGQRGLSALSEEIYTSQRDACIARVGMTVTQRLAQELGTECARLKRQLMESESGLKKCVEEKARLEKENDALRENVERLREEYGRLEKAGLVAEAKRKLEEQKTKELICTIEQTVKIQTQNKETWEKEKSEAEATQKKIETELAVLKEKLSGVEAELSQKKEERDKLEAEIARMRPENEGLDRERKTLDAEIEGLKKEHSEWAEKLRKHEDLFHQCDLKLRTVVSDIKKTIEATASEKAKADSIKATLESMTATIAPTTDRLAKVTEETRRKLDSLSRESEERHRAAQQYNADQPGLSEELKALKAEIIELKSKRAQLLLSQPQSETT